MNPLTSLDVVQRTGPDSVHLEALYAQLAADGLAPASVLQIQRIASRALKLAMQRGKVRRNVASLVQPPSVHREEIRPLTAARARAAYRCARAPERGPLGRWALALALGLRQGEALGLAWDAVDLDAGALTVRQALQRRPGGGLVLVPPKSRAGRRTIPMPEQLVEVFRAHRIAQATERLAAGSMWTDSGVVFTGPTGKPVDPGPTIGSGSGYCGQRASRRLGCMTPATPPRRSC